MLDKVIFIIILIAISLFLIFLCKYVFRFELNDPAVIFNIIWMSTIIIGVATLNFEFSYLGLSYVVLLCIVAVLTSRVFCLRTKSFNDLDKKRKFNVGMSRIIVIFATLLGDTVVVLNLHKTGISINQLFDLSSLMSVNNQMAVTRYSGVQETSVISQLLLIFEYFAPISAGYHCGSTQSKKDLMISCFGLTPALFALMVQNTKSGVLASVFLYFSSYMIAHIYEKRKTKLRLKNMVKYFVMVLSLLSLLFVSMILRTGHYSIVLVKLLVGKFVVYALGQVAAFDYWFSNHGIISYGFGKNTFIGVTSFFGINERIQGVYNVPVYIGQFSSNIYSTFRGVIQDYGTIGCVIFVVLMFGVAKLAYEYLSVGRAVIFSSFILLNVYFFVFISPLSSPWTYVSYIMALFLFIPYLMIVRNNDGK